MGRSTIPYEQQQRMLQQQLLMQKQQQQNQQNGHGADPRLADPEDDEDESDDGGAYVSAYDKLLGAFGVGDGLSDDEEEEEEVGEAGEEAQLGDSGDEDSGEDGSGSGGESVDASGDGIHSGDDDAEGADTGSEEEEEEEDDNDESSNDDDKDDDLDDEDDDLDDDPAATAIEKIRRTDPGFAGDGRGDFGENDSGSESESNTAARSGSKRGGKRARASVSAGKGDADLDEAAAERLALSHLSREVTDAEERAADRARSAPLRESWESETLGMVSHDGSLPERVLADQLGAPQRDGGLRLRRRLAIRVLETEKGGGGKATDEGDSLKDKPRPLKDGGKKRGAEAAAAAAAATAAAAPEEERVLAAMEPRTRDLVALMSTHRDLYVTTRGAAGSRADRFTRAYCIHALDHVLKTRDRVLKNRDRLRALKEPPLDDTPYRDRGYTRATVLILVPFRNAAHRVVKQLLELSPAAQHDRVMNKRKLAEEFGDDGERARRWASLPRDHRRTFDGNTDDCFRLGISFSRKSVKVFADFYASDVIVASPLGLQMLTGTAADQDRGRGELDFLSSIEVCIVDQANAIAMQNMQHLSAVLSALNRIPRADHGADITRLRGWYIDGRAALYRQTIVLGAHRDPQCARLVRAQCRNTLGRAEVARATHAGVIHLAPVTVAAHVFQRVECESVASSADARLHHFETRVLPRLRSAVGARTVVFVPSYLDYTRLRGLLRESGTDHAPLCEYTSDAHLTRARGNLVRGSVDIALYTERLHYFRRLEIRGARNVVFYQLPAHEIFYAEVAAVAAAGGQCLALFTMYDADRVERVVGTERAERLLTGEKGTHLFAA
jgi:U3 small nucleolar RNA-associated protein 25